MPYNSTVHVCVCACVRGQSFTISSLQDLTDDACSSSLRQLTFFLADKIAQKQVESAPYLGTSSCAHFQENERCDLSRDDLSYLSSTKSGESVSLLCPVRQWEVGSDEEWQVRQSVVVSKEALHNTEKRSHILPFLLPYAICVIFLCAVGEHVHVVKFYDWGGHVQ